MGQAPSRQDPPSSSATLSSRTPTCGHQASLLYAMGLSGPAPTRSTAASRSAGPGAAAPTRSAPKVHGPKMVQSHKLDPKRSEARRGLGELDGRWLLLSLPRRVLIVLPLISWPVFTWISKAIVYGCRPGHSAASRLASSAVIRHCLMQCQAQPCDV